MSTLDDISAFLQKGRANEIKTAVQKAIDEGIDAKTILEEGLMAGMNIIGGKFKRNEVYVPEVLIAARAMNAGLEPLKPRLVSAGVESKGTVVIGTVKGDLHDIGKNLVASMLEGGGFEVTDLGVDVSPERFITAVREKAAHIVCLSALLTVTVPSMKSTIEALKQAGLRDQVKVLVGGAPMTADYAREIGADAYGENASVAVSVARRICAAA